MVITLARGNPSISRFVALVSFAVVFASGEDGISYAHDLGDVSHEHDISHKHDIGHKYDIGHKHDIGDVSHTHDSGVIDIDGGVSNNSGISDGDTNVIDRDTSGDVAAIPAPLSTSASLILEVQPIQVCDDGGIVCAQVELFEAITDKIWGQAGIDVVFLPTTQLNDSTYLTTDDYEFFDLSFTGNPGDFGRHPDSTDTSGPISLWFVDEIETSSGLVQYGNAWIGFNGVLISDDILDFGTQGRIDVLAHELGHNLGLRHSTFGAGTPENLLSSGSDRTIPDSINDIFPDGAGLSQLTPAQIDVAQNSAFVTVAPVDNSLPAVDDSLPVVDDSSPVVDDSAPVVDNSAPVVDNSAPTVEKKPVDLLAKGSARDSAPTLIASTPAATIPESAPSLLTWLLLLPLGQRVYSRINR